MRNLILAILVFIVSNVDAQKLKVLKVYDGDTYQVLLSDSVKVKVRLWAVDAPELTQEYGDKIQDTISKLLVGKSFKFKYIATDLYGRALMKIEYKRGKDLGEMMIKNGWAWAYCNIRKYNNDLLIKEKKARNNKYGLWSGQEIVRPSDYRRAKKIRDQKTINIQ